MSKLTTHILDTASGVPAAGVRIELFEVLGADYKKLASTVTNGDGRTDRPLLELGAASDSGGAEFHVGTYELRFFVKEYFDASTHAQSDPAFLDVVPIRFSIASIDQHYHVPLLVSPWSYSTYRGS